MTNCRGASGWTCIANRELVNNAKMGVSRPSQLGKFAHFRVLRLKLNCREVQHKELFHQNGVQGCSGESAREGVLQEGSMVGR